MKTVYIPKGETVHYESLATEYLVVHGRLHVTYHTAFRYCHIGDVRMAIIVSEMPRKAAGVSGMNAGLPRKQPVCADVKQTRRNQCSDLLVLGARAIGCC